MPRSTHHTELDRILDEEGRLGTWLAQRVGVNVATVTRWRHGYTGVEDENMVAVAVALGRNPDDAAFLFGPPCPEYAGHMTAAA